MAEIFILWKRIVYNYKERNEMAADEKLDKIRHSMAHVMAEAVIQMFPDAKVAIGPSIENGFYYDFDLPRALKPEDLEEIENRMKDILKSKKEFQRSVVSKQEALSMFKNQEYKVELINDLPKMKKSLCIIRVISQTCAGDPMLKIPASLILRDSSSFLLQVHTGEAMKKGLCFRGFTEQPGPIPRT